MLQIKNTEGFVWGSSGAVVIYNKKFLKKSAFSITLFRLPLKMSMLPFVFKEIIIQLFFNSKSFCFSILVAVPATAWEIFGLNKFLKMDLTFIHKNYTFTEFIKNYLKLSFERLRNLSYLLKSTINKMIIGIDVSSIAYGTGVSNYTLNLVRHLLKNNHQTPINIFFSLLRQPLPKEIFLS